MRSKHPQSLPPISQFLLPAPNPSSLPSLSPPPPASPPHAPPSSSPPSLPPCSLFPLPVQSPSPISSFSAFSHPPVSLPSFALPPPHPPLLLIIPFSISISIGLVSKAVLSFPPDSAHGPSSLRSNHLKDGICCPFSQTAKNLLLRLSVCLSFELQ